MLFFQKIYSFFADNSSLKKIKKLTLESLVYFLFYFILYGILYYFLFFFVIMLYTKKYYRPIDPCKPIWFMGIFYYRLFIDLFLIKEKTADWDL